MRGSPQPEQQHQRLRSAVSDGDEALVRSLLDAGVDPNARGEYEQKPVLHAAAEIGHVAIVKMLIDAGADVHADAGGELRTETALHEAALRGHDGVIRLLVGAGADANASKGHEFAEMPLNWAARQCHRDAILALIEAGADVNLQNMYGHTALHDAADSDARHSSSSRHLAVVRDLIDAGIDVNARSNGGETALHTAAHNGDLALTRLLLASGADANIRSDTNFGGQTPLDTALQWKRIDVMHALLDHGVDVTSANEAGITAIAAHLGNYDTSGFLSIARVLCQHGATFDEHGATFDEVAEAEMRRAEKLRGGGASHAEAMRACFEAWEDERRRGVELTEIPMEAFLQGVDAIQTYVAELSRSTHAVTRHKLCVVGPTTWGKTSLIKSLTRQDTVLEALDTRTVGIDVFPWSYETASGDQHEVTLWDFAGQEVYHTAHTLFFSARTLFLVVVDLSAYAGVLPSLNERVNQAEARVQAFVDANIIHWLRLIIARQPDASIVVVGTKADLLESEIVAKEIQSDLTGRLTTWLGRLHDGVKARGIEAKNEKRMAQWLAAVKEWIVLSSRDRESIHAALRRLQAILLERGNGFVMPDKYSLVLDKVRARRGTADVPIDERVDCILMQREDVFEWLSAEIPSIDRAGCNTILRMLHDLGDVLWFHEGGREAVLGRLIALAPDVVIDLVRELISHELFQLFSPDDGHPQAVTSEDHDSVRRRRRAVYDSLQRDGRFSVWRQHLCRHGQVDHALLMRLPFWQNLGPGRLLGVKALLQKFGLVFPADERPMRDRTDLVVPAYWQMTRDLNTHGRDTLEYLGAGESQETHASWSLEYIFCESELPATLFEEVIVRSSTPFVKRAVTLPTRVVDVVSQQSALSIELVTRSGRAGRRVIRVEAFAVDAELARNVGRFGCQAVEQVLESYPGLLPDRLLWNEGDGSSVFLDVSAEIHDDEGEDDWVWLRSKPWRSSGSSDRFPRLDGMLKTSSDDWHAPPSLRLRVMQCTLPLKRREATCDWTILSFNASDHVQSVTTTIRQPQDWSRLVLAFDHAAVDDDSVITATITVQRPALTRWALGDMYVIPGGVAVLRFMDQRGHDVGEIHVSMAVEDSEEEPTALAG
ncbi:hypothetical protein ATCC90586_007612 [Pythium insidiosum]|nr:hypothetical protein ATCC90586_007612 [Pythium insidiosum]